MDHIEFLDTLVKLQDGRLYTDLYVKLTDKRIPCSAYVLELAVILYSTYWMQKDFSHLVEQLLIVSRSVAAGRQITYIATYGNIK